MVLYLESVPTIMKKNIGIIRNEIEVQRIGIQETISSQFSLKYVFREKLLCVNLYLLSSYFCRYLIMSYFIIIFYISACIILVIKECSHRTDKRNYFSQNTKRHFTCPPCSTCTRPPPTLSASFSGRRVSSRTRWTGPRRPTDTREGCRTDSAGVGGPCTQASLQKDEDI